MGQKIHRIVIRFNRSAYAELYRLARSTSRTPGGVIRDGLGRLLWAEEVKDSSGRVLVETGKGTGKFREVTLP